MNASLPIAFVPVAEYNVPGTVGYNNIEPINLNSADPIVYVVSVFATIVLKNKLIGRNRNGISVSEIIVLVPVAVDTIEMRGM